VPNDSSSAGRASRRPSSHRSAASTAIASTTSARTVSIWTGDVTPVDCCRRESRRPTSGTTAACLRFPAFISRPNSPRRVVVFVVEGSRPVVVVDAREPRDQTIDPFAKGGKGFWADGRRSLLLANREGTHWSSITSVCRAPGGHARAAPPNSIHHCRQMEAVIGRGGARVAVFAHYNGSEDDIGCELPTCRTCRSLQHRGPQDSSSRAVVSNTIAHSCRWVYLRHV